MGCPCETRTSTCRSFATISSGLYRFLAIAVLLDVKDIPQVGPLQWGRIIGELLGDFDQALLDAIAAIAAVAGHKERLPSLGDTLERAGKQLRRHPRREAGKNHARSL